MSNLAERPVVTIALFAYNQERFVVEALDAALAQDYSPLELVISDDCSSDRTCELIESRLRSYKGGHTIIFNRNPVNLGVALHVNRVMDIASGDFVVMAAGDDISAPNRVEEVVKVWKRTGASAVYCGANLIDEKSEIVGAWPVPNIREKIAFEEGLKVLMFYGAGAAYERRVFDRFGPLPQDIRNEDYNLAVRALLLGGVAYANQPLLNYRQHDRNLSFSVKIRQAEGFQQIWQLKVAMYANNLANQRYILEYITEICGTNSKAYKDRRSLMLLTLLHFKVYRILARIGKMDTSLELSDFEFAEYAQMTLALIGRLPSIVARKARRFCSRDSQ